MMKSTKIKRLSLNKKTIANLGILEMGNVFAGNIAQQQPAPVETDPPECIISTYTYYTCPPWSCGVTICKLPVHD